MKVLIKFGLLLYISTDSNSFKNRYLLRLFLLGAWGLMMTVLTNAYTTDLIAVLTAPKLKRMPRDLEELSKEPHLKISLEKDTVLHSLIMVNFIYSVLRTY